jgi:putative ABC transport system ATP-binding protein
MNTIHVEQLEKEYHDNGVPVRAVRGVTFDIRRGEFLAIAGPSGSGKTTLLNLLGALDHPTGGCIRFDDRDLGTMDKKARADLRLHTIGFIFQAYNLIPVLSAQENVEFKLMLLGIPERERRDKARAILEQLQIGELAHKRPNEMSGGQQQRVAIARAIVNEPPLVLADEPTANLDSVTAHALLDLMLEMNAKHNITFVFSSHDRQVLEHARRVVYLRDGAIETDARK